MITNPRTMIEFCEETVEWNRCYRNAPANIPVLDIEERLRRVEKRLLILDPPPDTLEKHPALANAYREYKLIERLVLGNDQT